MKAGQEANADSMLLGESYKEQQKNEKQGHIGKQHPDHCECLLQCFIVSVSQNIQQLSWHVCADALMGKLIMSDMFSEKETNEIKSALMRAGSDLGEGKAVPAHKDQIALAKGQFSN